MIRGRSSKLLLDSEHGTSSKDTFDRVGGPIKKSMRFDLLDLSSLFRLRNLLIVMSWMHQRSVRPFLR